jgi:Pyruvate/2-oxoacid:ferredoxin oxidoreductase delta subunit
MTIANWPRCAIYVRMCTGGGHGKSERPGWGRFGRASVGMCVSRVPPMISACAAVGCRVCHRYCHHVAILGTKGRSKTNPFVHMEVRGCSLQKTSSRKHADSKQHRLAAVAPQKGDSAPSGHLQHTTGNRDA